MIVGDKSFSATSKVGAQVLSEREFEAFCIAIARLPNEWRKAFVLKKVCQYSDGEIAEHSGVSVCTAEKHIKRGFELVQRYREERPVVESQ